MKCALSALAVILLVVGAAKADGNVAPDMLAKMGLDGLKIMTDSQGLEVRGMGYHSNVVYGVSFAIANNAFAAGSYYASGNNYATGSSKSIAISVNKIRHPRHPR